jgi:molecular chaperone Hsp33
MGLKEPYVGQTHLVSGEIAEDLTYYFATSEQVNSSVALGVLMEKDNTVKQAGGFILQLMPFAEEDVIAKLEKNIGALPSVTTMLEEGNRPEDIIQRVLDGMDVEIMDKIPTGFECNCSKERVERAIISIGRDEIQSMIDDGQPIEVNCHFCSSHYIFTVDDLEEILKKV